MGTSNNVYVILGEVVLEHTLAIDSNLMGITFILDGVEHTTPYSESMPEGIHRIEMPSEVTVEEVIYYFDQWENGSKSPSRNVNLTKDMTLTATYSTEKPPPPEIPWWILLAAIGGILVAGSLIWKAK